MGNKKSETAIINSIKNRPGPGEKLIF